MENASKALIMAGSVLLSMLIVGALVLMFTSLSNLRTQEASTEEMQKLVEYNKEMESFNRNLYGSELLSLANLITDYNIRQSGLIGYKPVTLEVKMKVNSSNEVMTSSTYNDKTLIENFKNLEKKVEYWQNGYDKDSKKDLTIRIGSITRTAQQVSSMRPAEIEELIRKYDDDFPKRTQFSQDEFGLREYQQAITDYLNEKIPEIQDQAQTYSNLKTEMVNFKNLLFTKVELEYKEQYDTSTGRIIKMVYEQ